MTAAKTASTFRYWALATEMDIQRGEGENTFPSLFRLAGENTHEKSENHGDFPCKKEEKSSFPREHLPCLRKALAILEYADNTEKSLREKLKRADFSEDSVEASLAYLKRKRLFSEERYFERYTLALAAKKFYGPLRIFRELRAKGFREDLIQKEKCEENLLSSVDFAENCAILIAKSAEKDAILLSALKKERLSQREDLQKRQKALQKLYGALSRRGFTSGQIREALILASESLFDA